MITGVTYLLGLVGAAFFATFGSWNTLPHLRDRRDLWTYY